MRIELEPLVPTKYKLIRYPGGELQVRLNPDTISWLRHVVATEKKPVEILARLTCPKDIVHLALLKDAIDGAFPEPPVVDLILPYLPYARADRRFCDGDCFGLRTFAKLLKAMDFNEIFTLDVHSEVAKKEIPNLLCYEPTKYIKQTITDFSKLTKSTTIIALYPDEGAAKRYFLPEYIGCNTYQVKVISKFATKKRDPLTGQLLQFEVPELDYPTLIIDDICDGGGTFVGIKKEKPEVTMGLYTTHGIYSKSLGPLIESKFAHVYTTDTIKTYNTTDYITVYPFSGEQGIIH